MKLKHFEKNKIYLKTPFAEGLIWIRSALGFVLEIILELFRAVVKSL